MRIRVPLVALVMLVPAIALPHLALAANCGGTSVGLTAVSDLGQGEWRGYEGGLYPGGGNAPPASHAALGTALGNLIFPRNAQGAPDLGAGRIVFLSIGMSNAAQESNAFLPLSRADPEKHRSVLFVNGAQGGQTASKIRDPTAPYWTHVESALKNAGATGLQVQAVWIKEANAGPTGDPVKHAKALQDDLAAVVGVLKVKFPNLMHVYLSSRIYAGYASTGLNPEPYAYASAFSVKWLIESQMNGTLAGDDALAAVASPWIAWGPYLWANGTSARSDGVVWLCSDLAPDGTHPSGAGAQKVARMLLDFVRKDPIASSWYKGGGIAA